jgi:putative methyltransferase (TIGR04325 family)
MRRRIRSVLGWRWFRGEYQSWADACAASSGYDDDLIVDRVLAATFEVKAGRSSFERDSVLFDSPEIEEGLIAALLTVAGKNDQCLRVLDFGGALGSTWWRHRAKFGAVRELCWDIVEQAKFVEAGRRHLSDTPLRFFENIEQAKQGMAYDVLLASGVVHYLESPHEMIQSWVELKFPYLLFNNLPLHKDAPDRLMVQHVPPSIYPASYPVWFFNRDRFIEHFTPDYEIVSEFASEAVWPMGWRLYPSTGLFLKRKTTK